MTPFMPGKLPDSRKARRKLFLNSLRSFRCRSSTACQVSYGHSQLWPLAYVRAQERIHWHNVPVVMDGGGEGDFFKQLEASARPQDFVAVKVDIDGGPETQIVKRIADSPKFARLVDELYFGEPACRTQSNPRMQ